MHEVNERTPALAVQTGSKVQLQRFPIGTTVVYPAEPTVPALALRPTIRTALAEPVGSEPLTARLAGASSVTIVFGDSTAAVPATDGVDPRGQAIEEILTVAAAAGVDDIALVCARGLQRRLTEDELLAALGRRVHESFAPLGLISQHDGEASDLVAVGEDSVPLNRRVAESDLVITVQATDSRSRTGSHLLVELAGVSALATARGAEAETGAEAALGAGLAAALPVFAVEIAVDAHPVTERFAFLTRREWEWGPKEKFSLKALQAADDHLPARARARVLQQTTTPTAVLAVSAGAPLEVGTRSSEVLLTQQRVIVGHQVNTLVTGLPQVSAHGVGAWLNPLLAAHLALAEVDGSHTGTPFLADGGSLIVFGSAEPRYHHHHTATADFVSQVLPGAGPGPAGAEAVAAAERRFAGDSWYRHLYQHGEAHHPLQPFHLWHRTAAARARLSSIIWVGGDRQTCAAMGFRAATTLADALEMVGGPDSLGYVHNPPLPVIDLADQR